MKKLIIAFLFALGCTGLRASEHSYSRDVSTGTIGGFNIDNPYRLDGSLDQIRLAVEVESALPGKTFILRCNGTDATFYFDQTLSAGEITTLDGVVSDHKNNN